MAPSDPLALVTDGVVPARAVSLAGLVDYVAGSVVSKTLAKKASGSITLFAFDAGQGLSEHQTPHDAFVQVVDGVGTLRIGGQDVVAKTGDVVLMPANVPHAVQAIERFKMLLVMIRS